MLNTDNLARKPAGYICAAGSHIRRPRRRLGALSLIGGGALALVAVPASAKTDPTIVLQVAPAQPSTYGTKLTFYAIIKGPTSADPAPTGSITFAFRDAINNNHPICTVAIDTNAALQSCAYPNGFYPAAGTDRFIVIYSGDSNYNGDATGTFAKEDYTINKADIALSVATPPVVFVGQYAVFEYSQTVPGTPSGLLGISIPSANGGCSAPLSGTTYEPCTSFSKMRFAGTFHFSLSYGNDDNFNDLSVADAGTITILPAPTKLNITATPATIGLGASTTVSANVASIIDPGALLVGSVTVSDGEVSCQTPTFSGGAGSCVLTPLSAGAKTLTATFAGIEDVAAASQATAALTVDGPRTDGVCGSDDGKTLSAPPIHLCSAGTASAVGGSGPWTWSCAGSGGGLTASCSAQLLTSTPTTTALALAPIPAVVGAPVTAVVTISSAAPARAGNGTVAAAPGAVAGGTATVSGGGAACTATISNGSGSCSLIFGTAGTYTITANYSGDATNAPSSGSASEVVSAAVGTGSVISAPTLDRWALWMLAAGLAAFTLSRKSRRR